MNFIARQFVKAIKNEITNQSHVCGLGRTLSYKSAYSLDNLYPKSSLKLYTPNFVPEDPNAKFNGFIPMDELQISYSRSSGPGGQNVNRVNTKVDLRFNVKNARWLNDELKPKLLDKYSTKINKNGDLIIKSDVTRSQQLNLADALEKLRFMIRQVAKPPPQITEETEERLRRRHLKAARERLIFKRRLSDIKNSRQNSDSDF
ncbi:peptidyl-tRNA hydrolase ICT1, mitochondrial [Diprion similis]|uniref:peptidyl-tRNA hydrolase ICT1, mitochondrial n=1 Tax=Diprion similis TaxID=362088 RepID=UPI001EF92247|nr:peptidyl-tRNA hydrolase ICT1, mitochondrial [Diprion similis]